MEFETNINNITTEELHANPDNLNFYLAKSDLIDPSFEIIKKQTFESAFGEMELAIIGSSHYFLLKGQFIEIMTCSEEEYQHGQLIFNETKQNSFTFGHLFNSFSYKLSVKTENFADTTSFLNFEKMLLKDKTGFFHAFSKNSAITAINHISTPDVSMLKTKHTYPEYNKVISSVTELTLH